MTTQLPRILAVEQLAADNHRLRAIVEGLATRVVAQAELLAAAAERHVQTSVPPRNGFAAGGILDAME